MNAILSSLEHITCGMMMLESIYHTLGENNPFEDLFDYCIEVLKLLNNVAPNPFNFFIASQFKLAETLGFWLQFDFMLDDDVNRSEKYAFLLKMVAQ
jgi:recombinational DNA repair protein (RecF pathway)